ncbi:YybH family protein [Yeosuana aromativorans]|nr:nuclear transport factor 2 family protein [Yeosuana aromativorans]
MKTPSLCFVLWVMLSFISCNKKTNTNMIDSWKQEILDTELRFSNMAQKEGMNTAFLAFVADNGVLLRNDKLIKGKESIKSYMKNSTSKGLSWKPDFVDVSNSGDLGYTYGKYTYRYQDSLGNDVTSKGIFHTVWKRQPDGSWKFVWD